MAEIEPHTRAQDLAGAEEEAAERAMEHSPPIAGQADKEGSAFLSLSLAAIAGAAAVALELAATQGNHRVVAVGWLLEAYAVFFGAPVFLSALVQPISKETTGAAKNRRYAAARVLRRPWREGSMLRKIASWVIIVPTAWVVIGQVVHAWIPPVWPVALALMLGFLLGLVGWISVLIPKSWVRDPVDEDVVTLRWLINHPDAAPAPVVQLPLY